MTTEAPMFQFMHIKNRMTAPIRTRMAAQLKEARRLRRQGNRIGPLTIRQWIKHRRKSAAGQRANVAV